MEKSNAIVRIHRPKLTPEEHNRRMEAIRKAAVALVLATERAKQEKARTDNTDNTLHAPE